MSEEPQPVESWALTEELQLFAQEHGDPRVRKVWLAWYRAQLRIREQADVLIALKTKLTNETNKDFIGFQP